MKFHGNIGFIQTTDAGHSVYKANLVEKPYFGDVLKYSKRYDAGQQVHDELTINNQISIVADVFAYQNIGYMRYVVWNGQKWAIISAELDYPRILLTIGGLYNVTGNREGSTIQS